MGITYVVGAADGSADVGVTDAMDLVEGSTSCIRGGVGGLRDVITELKETFSSVGEVFTI
jgi:hypothetical protein